jgi:hypothetical protein
MVLVFLPTKLGHKKKVNVGYSSTMEHMGWMTLSHIAFKKTMAHRCPQIIKHIHSCDE